MTSSNFHTISAQTIGAGTITTTNLGNIVYLDQPPVPRSANPDALTDGQVAVLRAFHEFGRPMDDLALTVYVHHVEDDPMSSSSIRSRRAELSRGPVPLLAVVETKRMKSGRRAAVHALTPDGEDLAAKLFAR